MTSLHTDILIIGAGGAGLMAATEASAQGFSVNVLCKTHPLSSHTVAAKGGMNAALSTQDEDHWHWHMYDTLHGSDWLADHDAVALLCKEAPAALIDLEKRGMPFTRNDSGRMAQRIYGGQSTHFGKEKAPHRACFVADRTGQSLLHTLYQQALKSGVTFTNETMALELIRDDHSGENNQQHAKGVVHGVFAWKMDTGELLRLTANAVILAAGGCAELYATTTSSRICTGDGNALAFRAGIPLQDMEFVQFHPTGLYGSGVLITEAARSEGALLLNGERERFMTRYAAGSMELAPRDIIARAIATEITQGRGAGPKKDHVLLSLTHLDSAQVAASLPMVCETAKRFAHCDALTEAIPIVPSAHFTMGGVPTDKDARVLDANRLAVPGLYAIGENASASVHGANRLGCNALLELVVFGKRVVATIAEDKAQFLHKKTSHNRVVSKSDPKVIEALFARAEASFFNKQALADNPTSPTEVSSAIKRLKSFMSEYVGVFRNEEGLAKAFDIYHSLAQEAADFTAPKGSLMYHESLRQLIEYLNMLDQAGAVIRAAQARKESRGSHFRDDFPLRDDEHYRRHSLVSQADGVTFTPVRTPLLEDAPVCKPVFRAY